MELSRILFRCDGGPNIGLGHIVRCLCLAQEFRDFGIEDIFFMTHSPDGASKAMIEKFSFKIVPSALSGSKQDCDKLVQWICSWDNVSDLLVVLDSYAILADYRRKVKACGCKILCLDDEGKQPYKEVNWVLNPNIDAQNLNYSHLTKVLAGSQYTLLRKEFRNSARKYIQKQINHLLIVMGGADAKGQTKRVLKALNGIEKPFAITVILKNTHPDREIVENLATNHSHKVQIESYVSNMAQLLEKIDFAITAGGSTCYEMAAMGVPHVIIVVAQNQVKLAQAMHRYGCSYNLGWYLNMDEITIAQKTIELTTDINIYQQMFLKGRDLIDGQGAFRVVKEICKEYK